MTFGQVFSVANTQKNKYLYGGKELQDEKFGSEHFNQYDFEARFYDGRLGRFTAIDPLAEKYFSALPYMYCNNNPVLYVDPTGMDWFMNELTGSIYYNSTYTEKSLNKLEGDGWAWLGANGMFGVKDLSAFISAGSTFETHQNELNLNEQSGHRLDEKTGEIEGSFHGNDAVNFMDKNGYEQKVTQAVVYSQDYPPIKEQVGSNKITIKQGIEVTIEEKWSYIPKANTVVTSVPMSSHLEVSDFLSPGSVSRRQFSYQAPGFVDYMFMVLNSPLLSNHSYINKTTYKGWGSYPGNNSKINEFRSREKK